MGLLNFLANQQRQSRLDKQRQENILFNRKLLEQQQEQEQQQQQQQQQQQKQQQQQRIDNILKLLSPRQPPTQAQERFVEHPRFTTALGEQFAAMSPEQRKGAAFTAPVVDIPFLRGKTEAEKRAFINTPTGLEAFKSFVLGSVAQAKPLSPQDIALKEAQTGKAIALTSKASAAESKLKTEQEALANLNEPLSNELSNLLNIPDGSNLSFSQASKLGFQVPKDKEPNLAAEAIKLGFKKFPKDDKAALTFATGIIRSGRPDTTINIDLEKSTKGSLEKDIIRGGSTLAELNEINHLFKPEFLTFFGKAKSITQGFLNKLGIVDKAEFLKEQSSFISQAQNRFQAYRKWATGVAGGEKEIGEIKKAVPNVDDPPIVFQSKVTQAIRWTKILNRWLLDTKNKGLSLTETDNLMTQEGSLNKQDLSTLSDEELLQQIQELNR